MISFSSIVTTPDGGQGGLFGNGRGDFLAKVVLMVALEILAEEIILMAIKEILVIEAGLLVE